MRSIGVWLFLLATLAALEPLVLPDTPGLRWTHGAPQFGIETRAGIFVGQPDPARGRIDLRGTGWSLAVDAHAADLIALRCGHRDLESALVLAVQLAGEAEQGIITGTPWQKHDDYTYPIRIVETGPVFQHLMLDPVGDPAGPVQGRLELFAWHDRLRLSWTAVATRDLPAATAVLRWRLDGQDLTVADPAAGAVWRRGDSRLCVLDLALDGSGVRAAPSLPALMWTATAEDGRPVPVVPSACAGWRCALPPRPFAAAAGAAYPAADLDAVSRVGIEVVNNDSVAVAADMLIEHALHPITGFVPVLLDDAGRPTGIVVQVSKNWHSRPERDPLPQQGPWIRGRFRLELAAGERRRLTYAVVHATWGGHAAASVSQLSLVGYGSNGLWDQWALGSWGETLCTQPGRALRRALFTDLRPFAVLGMGERRRHDWTSNIGGGDVLVLHDAGDHYVVPEQCGGECRSPGPNLAEMVYYEELAGGAMRAETTVFLPQAGDCARFYVNLRCTVMTELPFHRLVWFQLGSDFYNECDARRATWGDAAARTGSLEFTPAVAADPLGEPIPLSGGDPWLALDAGTAKPADRRGRGDRGLIVRAWQARLGGAEAMPYLQWRAQPMRRERRLLAELVCPPGVQRLLPGDHVEAQLEVVLLPAAADDYWGADPGFAAALTSGSGGAALVQREAAGQRPQLGCDLADVVQPGWPPVLRLPAGAVRVCFTLDDNHALVPVRLTGLAEPTIGRLLRVGPAGLEPLDQDTMPWQVQPDPHGGWMRTYTMPGGGGEYVFER